MQFFRTLLTASCFILLLLPGRVSAQREYGAAYTSETLANIRANCEKYDWARAQRDKVTSAAEFWLAVPDEELWMMIPGQELPRTIDVTWDYNFPENARLGCLKCGDKIHNHGNYPYNPDFVNKPWKLTCPECGVVFPTNDFGKYYESGRDETGVFNPDKADKSLLFNTEHPDPADPLHKYGVDDGYGYVHEGRAHKYVGYYAWKYWRHLFSGLSVLSDSYMYTGDPRYAHKAAIMLDRISDVYPDMDWNAYGKLGWYHSDGSSRKGKVEGRIWENQFASTMSMAYDKIISGTIDAPELYKFLAAMAEKYKLPGEKGTRADLINNIDKGLLRTIAAALKSGQISGNQGMHQAAMANAALALNTEPETSEWFDWIFDEKGGALPGVFIGDLDRDGISHEAAPHYCFLWPAKFRDVIDLLNLYPAYTRNNIPRDFPHFRNAFSGPARTVLLNYVVPNIGDSRATGLVSQSLNAAIPAAGFKYFDDPVAAWYATRLGGAGVDTLLRDINSSDPSARNQEMQKVAATQTAPEPLGKNMAGYGLATFEFGKDRDGKALWMYYGRNGGHGHLDRLNYGIYAWGVDLTPDLGYPEFANSIWPNGPMWNNNTISHNTVTVDGEGQQENWSGYPRFYHVEDGFGVAEVDSPNVYPQTSEYARTVSFVALPDGNAYALDIMRVTGGKDHLLSFHGPPGAVEVKGLNLEAQTTGTYAGEKVPYASIDKAYPKGFSFLYNVEKETKPRTGIVQLDWKAETGYRGVKESDNIHLRKHLVAGLTEVALADGDPPQNKPGNPRRIRYALLRNQAQEKDAGNPHSSQFASIIEPWKGQPFIESVERLSSGDFASSRTVAMRVTMKNGIVDYQVSNPDGKAISGGSGLSMDGSFAWVRTVDGKVTSATLIAGTSLKFQGVELTGDGLLSGKLVRFEKDPSKETAAWVSGDLAALQRSRQRHQITFSNDGKRNACYDILSVTRDGDLWKVVCGPGSFVREHKDRKDYSKGFVFNIAEGAEYRIATVAILEKGE